MQYLQYFLIIFSEVLAEYALVQPFQFNEIGCNILRVFRRNDTFFDKIVNSIFRVLIECKYESLNFTVEFLYTLNRPKLVYQCPIQLFFIVIHHFLMVFCHSHRSPILDVLLHFFPHFVLAFFGLIADHGPIILIHLTGVFALELLKVGAVIFECNKVKIFGGWCFFFL